MKEAQSPHLPVFSSPGNTGATELDKVSSSYSSPSSLLTDASSSFSPSSAFARGIQPALRRAAASSPGGAATAGAALAAPLAGHQVQIDLYEAEAYGFGMAGWGGVGVGVGA